MKSTIVIIISVLVVWFAGWQSSSYFSETNIKMSSRNIDVTNIGQEFIVVQKQEVFIPELTLLNQYLKDHQYSSAIQVYQRIQSQGEEELAQRARGRILRFARALAEIEQHKDALLLLNLYTQKELGDIEALLLLAQQQWKQEYYGQSINTLYLARSYETSPELGEAINQRIHDSVALYARHMSYQDRKPELMGFYLSMINKEPDYAAYYFGLAKIQIALNLYADARNTLEHIVYNPNYSTRAAAIMASLNQLGESPEFDKKNFILLQRTGKHLLVEVVVNHKHKLNMLIDTDSEQSLIKSSVLQDQKIEYLDTGDIEILETVKGSLATPILEVNDMSIGEQQGGPVLLGVLENDEFPRIDGVIGRDFLTRFNFNIDYVQAKLSLIQ